MTSRAAEPLRVTLLLADDAPDFRELLRMCLARVPQFCIVAEAANGQEAVARTAEHRPDVVLLDLSMPVMDGLEAAPLIKQQHAGAKIVVLSGFQASEMEHKARAAGADAYVDKSAVLTDLEKAIFAVVHGVVESS